MTIHIRPLHADDLDAVAELLGTLARTFIVHDMPAEAAQTFLRENDRQAIAAHVANGFVYHVAEDNGAIAGFVGMREQQHLYHLFVDARWHRQGLARRLWEVAREAALAAGAAPPFRVNASLYAYEAYRRMGFASSAPMMEKNGLRFHPMRWTGDDDSATLVPSRPA